MQKRFVKFVLYIALAIVAALGIMIANNLLDRENILDRISKWPDLQVNTLEGEQFSIAEVLADKPVMLYYFNTECIFCKGTFVDLPNHPELKKESTLVFVSDENPGIISQFIYDLELGENTELLFFYDVQQQVKDFYAIRGVPAIYLYDHNGELTEFYRGAVGLEQIRMDLDTSNASD